MNTECLVIGKIYRDTRVKEVDSTYLKFVGYDDTVDSADFEYVSGAIKYLTFEDVIPFNRNEIFYELEPNENP